ncbi:hypothetical protein V5O48_007099 [Marasmius crinis-equi]|uniref:Uncharacterized protein n=1 Tax=Marasmius crinis-equi TaxID=585013 RepID=A0ABR3FI40_9AGAR
MDEHYKSIEAAARVTELAESQITQHHSERDFIAAVTSQPWPDHLHVERVGRPASYRLIAKETGQPDEEIVFIMHGVLVRKDLPPIEKALGKNSKAGYMSQQVVLSGLGSAVFDRAMDGINAVEKQFRRNLDDDEVETHKIFGTLDGHTTIELSNRYVTSIHATNGLPAIELERDIDPEGYLARAMGGKYVRTEENRVQFFEVTERSGKDTDQ